MTVANGYRERMRWEAHIVEIRGPSTCRSIACANDGGRWIFETSGDPLPIESTFPYEARRKADRFGTDQLAAVLTYLGVRPVSSTDILSADRFLMFESRQRDPAVQQRLQRWDCSPEEADDPAFGYWMRASAWIDHLDTHATSAVSDLTRAVALNPNYADRARPHRERAGRILGSTAYKEQVDHAMSLLKSDW